MITTFRHIQISGKHCTCGRRLNLCQLLQPYINPTNMVMIYLLAVVVAAIRLGLRPAVFTAFVGVLAFDFFFVPPRFTFQVADKEYVLTFLGLFTVGAVISSLVTNLREHSEALQERERQTAALYHLSRDLAAAADLNAIVACDHQEYRRELERQGCRLPAKAEKAGAGGCQQRVAVMRHMS